MTEDDQFFKFKRQHSALLFIDGNYMINISRALSLKIDIERLFDEITKEFFRKKTYWYSAIEANLDRSNSTFRFLDRLKYIPRTQVYTGRLTKKQTGILSSALRTDAGVALATNMVEQAMMKSADYIILIASDPEYIPAIRIAQRYGCIVRLVTPKPFGELRPHLELVKAADEKFEMDDEFLNEFEYVSPEDYFDEDETDGDLDILEDEIRTNGTEDGERDDETGDTETLEAQIDSE